MELKILYTSDSFVCIIVTSPSPHRRQPQLHAIPRLRRDDASRHSNHPGTFRLHFKNRNERSNQTSQLSHGEALTNTTPGSVQKGKLSIIASRAAVLVGFSIEVDPALWDEVAGRWTPERGRAVYGPGREDDLGSFGDVLVEDCGCVYAFADGDGDCREESEGFVADGVEHGEVF